MDLIKFSISKPVSAVVGLLLISLFGLIGIFRLPVQLTPDVEEPQITVTTIWPGATPYEVEKDVVEEQENVLKGIRNLTLMESSCFNSRSEITLTFEVGTDINSALLRVSNKLNEVRSYPENVEKPVIEASGARSSPVIWMVMKRLEGPAETINTYRTFFENEVRQYLERVPGVGSLFVFGGSETQLEVVISTEKLARYRMTIGEVMQRIQSANVNVSAGVLPLKKNNYRVRTVSQFQSPEDPLDVVIRDDGIRRIYLRDVAETRMGQAFSDVAVKHNGKPVIVCGVRKEQGANVIDMTRRMKAVIEELNAGLLAQNHLKFEMVYEQTPYINKAIDLVQKNVVVGGILAICVLLVFLRSISSTLVTAIAIPVSVIGTFIFMWIFQRSLNVVSLAGISFAVGMLVDNAIVVLENIDRHRSMGKSPFQASYEGAKEVWGAVLASTATTVAVFLPVIFIQEEAGQLFKDIAIAITFAIMISLVVSVSAIPSMTHQVYRLSKKQKVRIKPLDMLGKGLTNGLLFFSRISLKNAFTRITTVVLLIGCAVLVTFHLIPKAEYLPQGNRNLILNFIIPPPGYSINKRQELGDYVFKVSKPYFEQDFKDGIPQIKNIFFVASDRITLFGAISVHETRAREMMPLFKRIIYSIPGVFGISTQAGIFQTGLGRGRTVEVNISGDDMNRILDVSRMLFGILRQKLKQAQIRPVPSLENSYPEANFIPDRSKVLANGLTEAELGLYVDVIMDGRKIGEYKPEAAKKMDLVLRTDAKDIRVPEDISESLVANRFGNLIRVGDLSRLQYSQGMMQIDHLERRRNISLEVTPSPDMPLQQALEIIRDQVVPGLEKSGKLAGTTVSVGGNADKLTQAIGAIQWNLVMAAIIVYLLMSALLENFFYPFIILFSVPLAAAGGFVGLKLVDRLVAPQSFDIVTMLGFIILIGTVVNNAILIVYQALNNVRYHNLTGIDAVYASVKTRIRPIFMSTTTSLFGMMPLVVSTGPGSELYRGLGSVLLGGLAVSTMFTLFVIPALLAFFIRFEKPASMNPETDRQNKTGITTAVVILAVMIPGIANALSLEEIQQQAVANRQIVASYRNFRQLAKTDVQLKQSPFYPSVDVTYTVNQLDEDSAFENEKNSAISAAVRYNIFSGFRDTYQLKSAQLLEKARAYELDAILQDIKYAVALRYLDVFEKTQFLNVARDELNLLQKRYEDAKNRHEVGLINKNQLLKIRVELDDASQNVHKAQAEVGKSINLLKKESGMEISIQELTFSEFEQIPRIPSRQTCMDTMWANRSDINALKMVMASREFEIKSARAAYLPSVDISASHRMTDNDYLPGTDDPEDEFRIQLTVSLNLFNGFATPTAVNAATLRAKSPGYDLAELQQQLMAEMDNTLLDFDVAQKNIAVAQAGLTQAQENLRITDISFKQGVSLATDVLDAIYYLSRARYNLIKAKNGLFLNQYTMRRLMETF